MGRKLFIISLLLGAILFSQGANAALTTYLPASHYGDGTWQGTSYYNENGFNIAIDFAVYDKQAYMGDFSWAGKLDMPETDRYIYAYQIFLSTTTNEVGNFKLFYLDKQQITATLMHNTTSQDDLNEGIEPMASTAPGTWDFSPNSLITGQHSYFLIFSSNSAPVAGSYEVTTKHESQPPPVPQTPEPCTMALFGIGGLITLSLKKMRK